MTDHEHGQLSERTVVHVTIDGLFATGTPRTIDEAMRLTDELDVVLARHAAGWVRPSADEAFLCPSELLWSASVPVLDWADQIRDDVVASIGLDCAVGIASTRVAARVCSRLARPGGVLVWLDGYEGSLVSPVPLEDMDELRPEQVARLRASGVRTLGELAALEQEQAREALGSQAPRLLGMIRGLHASESNLDAGRAGRAVSLLARKLCVRLTRAGRRARGLELGVRYADGVERNRYTLLRRATDEVEVLQSAADRLLSMTSRREHRVAGLRLTATGLIAAGGQLDLFDPRARRELVVELGRTS